MTHSFPGSAELGYAETTSNGSSSSTTVGNDAWAGLTITVTVGARAIIVEAGCANASNGTAGSGLGFHIYEGATKLATAGHISSGAGEGDPIYCRARLTPTVGSHTYLVKINAITSGTATFLAGLISANFSSPAWIQATAV